MKKRVADTEDTLLAHHFIEKEKLRKYICGLLSLAIDEKNLEKITN